MHNQNIMFGEEKIFSICLFFIRIFKKIKILKLLQKDKSNVKY